MRLVLVAALLVGCVTPGSTFVCESSADCSGGTCEPDGFCSFADAACDSGRRYGDASGAQSGQCVGGGGNAVCGDGMVTGTEECEDGNVLATDFCVDCKLAKCGDGNLLAGIEECDDGNTVDGDGCNANCLDCGTGSVTNMANGHCYFVIETATDWLTAGDQCTARGGAYLATMSDAAENAFVHGLLVTATDYWIGLQDFSADDYLWEDGFRLGAFQGWNVGEPSTGAADETAAMRQVDGLWNQQDRDNVHPFICERSPWTIEPTTRHAYRAITGVGARADQAGARAGCAALPGSPHLVTITDAAEQTFVDAISSATQTYIGLDDVSAEGTYLWTTGEPFAFFAWGANEPTGAAEDCVVLLEDGTWGDRDCTLDFPNKDYICELDPVP